MGSGASTSVVAIRKVVELGQSHMDHEDAEKIQAQGALVRGWSRHAPTAGTADAAAALSSASPPMVVKRQRRGFIPGAIEARQHFSARMPFFCFFFRVRAFFTCSK